VSTTAANKHDAVAVLLEDAAETHHRVYRITEGSLPSVRAEHFMSRAVTRCDAAPEQRDLPPRQTLQIAGSMTGQIGAVVVGRGAAAV
jgi:hypothetical protein